MRLGVAILYTCVNRVVLLGFEKETAKEPVGIPLMNRYLAFVSHFPSVRLP